MPNGLCKRCVGAPVLIPADLVSCETDNPSCLPMRAGAELGAGFAFADFSLSKLRFALISSIEKYDFSCAKHVKSQYGVCTMLAIGLIINFQHLLP